MAKQTKPDVPTHKEDPILTCPEVAKIVGKTAPTIRCWIRDGLLDAIEFPGARGRFGVRKSDAMKLISNSALASKVVTDGN